MPSKRVRDPETTGGSHMPATTASLTRQDFERLDDLIDKLAQWVRNGGKG
jgi:hypothetical protein